MALVASRFEVYLVHLDPTEGREIRRTRPCLIISPDEMNRHIGTIIVAPMTTRGPEYPTRIQFRFRRKNGQIVLDHIRTVVKSRLVRRLGKIDDASAQKVLALLNEISAPCAIQYQITRQSWLHREIPSFTMARRKGVILHTVFQFTNMLPVPANLRGIRGTKAGYTLRVRKIRSISIASRLSPTLMTHEPPKRAAKAAANHVALVVRRHAQRQLGFEVETEVVER